MCKCTCTVSALCTLYSVLCTLYPYLPVFVFVTKSELMVIYIVLYCCCVKDWCQLLGLQTLVDTNPLWMTESLQVHSYS